MFSIDTESFVLELRAGLADIVDMCVNIIRLIRDNKNWDINDLVADIVR